MFERFTERARHAVVLAQDEARTLGHNYIGTEHLLLGLLREEEGIAARVLESRDVTLEEVRVQLVTIVGLGDTQETGQVPFTPRAKKVLELSLREALTLGHNWIGTEHLLLGLAREPDGLAATILADLGVSPRVVAEDVVTMMGGPTNPAYVAQFAVTAAEGSRSGVMGRLTTGPALRQLSENTLVMGWVLFGIAFGLGLLVGWLIWG